MQVVPTAAPTDTTWTDQRPDPVPFLSQAELRQLGLSRVAYVTALRTDEGESDYVIHGADGIAVAVVDDPLVAEELAEKLGLALVTVH